MLSFHTRRLGGFLSIQSSASRGTEIAIYIPVSRQKARGIPKALAARGPESRLSTHSPQNDKACHILLVSPNNNEVSALTKMLVHLGHHVIFDDAEGYAAGDNLAFDSGGQGFGSSHSSVFDETVEDVPTNLEAEQASLYDLVIINTTKSYAMGTDQFEAIAKRYPKTTLLFLHDQDSFTLPSADAFGLKKPFELNDLDRIISGTKKKVANVETILDKSA
jgi:hypothetical protein